MVFKGKWHRGYAQRAGAISFDVSERLRAGKNIWVHAVSVGEVQVVVGLIGKLKVQYPKHQIVLTVTTVTGCDLAQKKFDHCVIVLFSPLDFSWIVRKFFDAIRPELYIATETEIWPNLFLLLKRKCVPIAVINGRISDQSFQQYRWVRFLLAPVISHIAKFCMQTSTDAQRIKDLGAPDQRIAITGNMKFDQFVEDEPVTFQEMGIPQAEYFIAGSTHPGEEALILNIFSKLQHDFPDLRLILVPRHVDRSAEIVQLVERQGFHPVLYSLVQAENLELVAGDVLVIDTIGHLRHLYSLATIVFVGKSFTVGGGQNIIEPALHRKPIVVGPKTENFRDIVEIFLKNEALVQVDGPEDLSQAIHILLKDPQKMSRLGQSAFELIQKEQGATDRILQEVSQLL